MPIVRVALVARISRNPSKDAVGVTRQLEDCRQLAADRGFEVVEEFSDDNISAFDPDKPRPGWEGVMRLIHERKIDGIVCWNVDRLYRHPKELERLVDFIEHRSVSIFVCTGGDIDLSSTTGRMTARIVGSVARAEVERMSERIVREKRAAAELGRAGGGPAGFGYRWEEYIDEKGKTRKRRIVHEAEAEALRIAVKMILRGRSLARAQRGIIEELDVRMSLSRLRTILTSHRIVGVRQHWPEAERRRWEQEGGETGAKEYKGKWEPIVDYDDWVAVRKILLDRKRTKTRAKSSLLGGLVVCGSCYRKVRVNNKSGKPGLGESKHGISTLADVRLGKMGYCTTAYKCSRESGCGNGNVKSHHTDLDSNAGWEAWGGIEGYVGGMVEAAIKHSGITLSETKSPDKDVATWRVEREKLQSRRDGLLTLFTEGEITTAQFKEKKHELDARIGDIDSLLEESSSEAALDAIRIHGIDAFRSADTLGKRDVIRSVIEMVIVHPTTPGVSYAPFFNHSRIEIVWKGEKPDPKFVEKMPGAPRRKSKAGVGA